MNTEEDETPEAWIKLLVESGVPLTVAKEAADGPSSSAWGKRLGLIYVAAMMLLMAAFVLPIVMLSGTPCQGDFALNSGVSVLFAIFTAITAAGLAVGYAQRLAPINIRKSAFLGAFTNPQNIRYAKMMAKYATNRIGIDVSFKSYEAIFNKSAAPWFLWPTVVLGAGTILSLLLLPAACI